MIRNTEYCGGECHGDCDVIPTPCRDADALLRHITTITKENKKLRETLRLIQHHAINSGNKSAAITKILLATKIVLKQKESDNG
jgi:hypothetical protein